MTSCNLGMIVTSALVLGAAFSACCPRTGLTVETVRRGAITEPPPLLPAAELLEGVEVPVDGADGPCPERAAGGCWSGKALAQLFTALDALTRYSYDAWDQCRDRGEEKTP